LEAITSMSSPGFDERLRPFLLNLGGQGIDVDASPGKLRQHSRAVTTVGRQEGTGLAVLGARARPGRAAVVSLSSCPLAVQGHCFEEGGS
jgi:hypothetical protein